MLITGDPALGRRVEELLLLSPSGVYETRRYANPQGAKDDIEHVGPDAILLDLGTGASDSLERIDRLKEMDPTTPVLVLLDRTEHPLAVEALKRGAQDVLGTTQLNADVLDRTLRFAIERAILTRELKEGAVYFPTLVENSEVGIWTVDSENRTVFVNPRVADLLGYSSSELIGKMPIEFMDPKSKASASVKLNGLQRGEIDRLDLCYRRKDGTPLWAMVSANPLYDERGRYRGSMAMVTDITERKKQEEALHRLAAIVESSTDAIISEDLDGTILSWNRAAEQLYGYSAAEAIGRSIRFLAPPERQVELDGVLAAIRRGDAVPAFETIRKTRDGKLVVVSVSVSPIRDSHGTVIGASAIVRDVSGQKKLEEQFRQAQKMEAVGRLAGGVAHDFNNLLTVICGYASLLLSHTPKGSSSYEEVGEISKAAERAASLTRQLLAFSRKQILKPQVLELNPIISDLEKMLKRLIGEDIQLSTSLQKDLGRVKVDAGQMEQVVMNLAINARDAMPNGGKLILETRNVILEPGSVSSHPELTPGSYVVLSVSDTGVGMDKEIQSHLFEPFFTTKGLGKGTGLGLSTIYGIVRQSGGHITVYSEPGKGISFRVYLPNTMAKAESVASAGVPVATLDGQETILLVEDNELVRKLALEVLTPRGYQVVPVTSAEEALDYCTHAGFPDLILSDLVLPGMDGLSLCKAAARQKCGIKRLLMTGYTEGAILNQGVCDSGIPLLHKPFTPTVLLMKVREVLGGRDSAASSDLLSRSAARIASFPRG